MTGEDSGSTVGLKPGEKNGVTSKHFNIGCAKSGTLNQTVVRYSFE